MLRRGLTAAGLVIAAVVLMAGGRAAPASSSGTHKCSATDRQFLKAAMLSSQALTMAGQDYASGAISPQDALQQVQTAKVNLEITDPSDSALKLARSLMRGMIVEYGQAIRAKWKGAGDPGKHIYRSYALANLAHQVLVGVQKPLEAKGCQFSDLL